MSDGEKESYKIIYKNHGKFHYPKIAANLLRRKGEEYFEGVELTGSSKGTERNPKISRLE